MESLMLLKENRNGDIKGRACMEDRKNRETIKKEDADSHTVSTESVFINAAVDAHKVQDVATFDIPGACTQK